MHSGLKMRKINLADISPLMGKLVGFLEEIETPPLELTTDGKLQEKCIPSFMNSFIIIFITTMECIQVTIALDSGKWKNRSMLNMEYTMFMDLIDMEGIFIIFGDGLMEIPNLLRRTEVGWHKGKR